MATPALRIVEPKVWAPRRLDIACGQTAPAGFTGIDLPGSGADIEHDLFVYPWPIKSASVREARVSHFVEHIPHEQPASAVLSLLTLSSSFGEFRERALESLWDTDGWFMFWNEVHRILRPGAVIEVITPYVWNSRAFWDPTHTRYHHETTFMYLDPEWRKANALDHYRVAADFEIVVIEAQVGDDMNLRSAEQQVFARTHYKDVIGDISVKLKKR